ncbi:MAG: ABC transporter substrate-binding protein [Verrucomicrobiae bacterium]|nr:ABC transporter substrate-binding protein [Verrucomicrobiae bacterium]
MTTALPSKTCDAALSLGLWLWVVSMLAIPPALASGMLRLAVDTDPHSLDPAQVFSREEAMLACFVFNTLLEPNPEGGFRPGLAEALPETSLDGLTHTFRLRRGVLFSNGQEVEAADVVYTFERFFDPETAAATSSYFYAIAGGREFLEARKKEAANLEESARRRGQRWIEPLAVSGLRALDRHTVQIRLNQPDLSFLHVLTSPPGAIVPRLEIERRGSKFASQPVGAGPYVLREWVRGIRIRLQRNPQYFRPGQPSLDEVEIFVNVDRSTQAMMFERGELDFLNYLHDADYFRFKRDSKLRLLFRVATGSTPTFAFLNCELPPFTNRLVRQALNHAIDRDALAKALAYRGVPQQGPLPLTVRGSNRDLPVYEYNPARARALLTEAGFPAGFETTLWTDHNDSTWMKVALFVQESLRQIGVIAHLKEVAFPAFLEASGRRRTVPMGIWSWASAFDDPKDTLDSLLNGDNLTDEDCLNPSFYANPAVQQLFRDAVSEVDPARRLEIYRQIERRIVEDVPWIFLVQMNTEMLCQPWVKGFEPSGFWPASRLENCWIER